MPTQSAGILLYRKRNYAPQVFLAHPGGPFWRNKDEGAWSIPKGIVNEGEDFLIAAQREFKEETGFDVAGDFKLLGAFRHPAGKIVTAFAVEGNCDPSKLKSNTFSMMWPPKSGKLANFPEVDRGGWFTREEAKTKILKGQRQILDAFFADAAPMRLQLSRKKGFDLQKVSTVANGLSALVVARPSKWGNPFPLAKYGRAESLALYRDHIAKATEPGRLDPCELRGRNFACWCKASEDCHADILLELASSTRNK